MLRCEKWTILQRTQPSCSLQFDSLTSICYHILIMENRWCTMFYCSFVNVCLKPTKWFTNLKPICLPRNVKVNYWKRTMSAFAKSSANELKVWQLQLKRHFHSHPVALRQFTFIKKLRCCLAGSTNTLVLLIRADAITNQLVILISI